MPGETKSMLDKNSLSVANALRSLSRNTISRAQLHVGELPLPQSWELQGLRQDSQQHIPMGDGRGRAHKNQCWLAAQVTLSHLFSFRRIRAFPWFSKELNILLGEPSSPQSLTMSAFPTPSPLLSSAFPAIPLGRDYHRHYQSSTFYHQRDCLCRSQK